MSVEEMHMWVTIQSPIAPIIYCTKCGAGPGDKDITCPVTPEKQKARYVREQNK